MKISYAMLAFVVVVAGSRPALADNIQIINVGVHADTEWVTASQFDSALSNASDALQEDDDSWLTFDVECLIGFVRVTSPSTVYDGDDNVNTETEFYDIIDNASAYLVVVDSITWCGGVTATWSGCADINDETGIIVDRSDFLSTAGGILFAHEFGHSVGNTHHTLYANRVMNPSFGTSNNHVTTTECTRWQETVHSECPGTYCPLGRSGSQNVDVDFDSWPTAEARGNAPEFLSGVPIEELAAVGFADSIPPGLEGYYDQADVAVLRDILADGDQVRIHDNVLSLIGLLSDGALVDVQLVTDYLRIPRHATVDAGRAGTAAGIALGYLVNRTNSFEALDALLGFVSSKNESVATGAILGLGLSGHPLALSELENLATKDATAGDGGLFAQAISDNLLIAELGLEGYYEHGSAYMRQ